MSPPRGEVLVAVAAAGVNPVDLGVAGGFFHQMGMVHQPEHTGLGWDFAGTVLAAGSDVDLAVGTRVAGFVGGMDRDFGSFAEQLVVPAEVVAVVPDELDLVQAATVPLNGLTASALLELLGAPSGDGRLLIVGAAGAVGGYLLTLAAQRGWQVTGFARPGDEDYVRELGADFTTVLEPGWDAVADTAVLGEPALAAVRDCGVYVGVRPGGAPAAERGIRVDVVMSGPDQVRLADLFARTAAGDLPARVRREYPLEEVAAAFGDAGEPGRRGRVVVVP